MRTEGGARSASAGRAGLLLAAAVCLAALVRLASVSAGQLASPYDLMYESPNLATMRIIESGRSPYDSEVYAGVPFTLTPYTPLYFYVMTWLPEAAGRPFLVARLVSLAAILGCAVVLALRGRHAAAALFAAGVFLLSWPIATYATYLRMDPLALLLSALSVFALCRPTPRRVALAAVLAVLAVATKQTFVAAGVAGVLHLLCRDRRLALRYLAVAAGTAGALAAVATLLWGRGFWFSILVLRSNPISWQTFRDQGAPQLLAPVFMLLLAAALVTGLLAWRRRGVALLGSSPAPAYLLCVTAVLLATLGKEGASSLYFMELAFALPLWLVDESVGALASPRVRAAFLALVLLGVGVDAFASDPQRSVTGFPPNSAERDGGYYASVRAGLAKAGYEAPLVLNLGPPHYAYGIADRVCMNDMSTYDQAYEQGALDVAALEAAIRARNYDVVLVTRLATPEALAARPTRAAIEAVRQTYRLLWADSIYAYYGR